MRRQRVVWLDSGTKKASCTEAVPCRRTKINLGQVDGKVCRSRSHVAASNRQPLGVEASRSSLAVHMTSYSSQQAIGLSRCRLQSLRMAMMVALLIHLFGDTMAIETEALTRPIELSVGLGVMERVVTKQEVSGDASNGEDTVRQLDSTTLGGTAEKKQQVDSDESNWFHDSVGKTLSSVADDIVDTNERLKDLVMDDAITPSLSPAPSPSPAPYGYYRSADQFLPLSPNDPGPYANGWGFLFGRENDFMGTFGLRMGLDQDNLTPAELRFLHWVELHGLRSPCITIGHHVHPHFPNRTLRGLIANCSIVHDSAPLHIPTTLIITPHRLRHSPYYDRINTFLQFDKNLAYDIDHLLLTVFVLLERQDNASFWQPYLDLLPTELYVPVEGNDYSRLWLDASDAVNHTAHRAKVIDWQYQHMAEFFKLHPQLLPRGRHFNKALFLSAYNAVTARAMKLDFGVHRDTLCLVPYADLMNHRPNVPAGWRFHGKKAVNWYTGYDIKHGDPVFNNYGDFGNEVLLHDYGFVLHDNPHTCAHIWLRTAVTAPAQPGLVDVETGDAAPTLVPAIGSSAVDEEGVETLPPPTPTPPPVGMVEADSDPYWAQRLAVLEANGMSLDDPICIQLGPPSLELTFAALVLTHDGDTLPPGISLANFSTLITADTMGSAQALIRHVVASRLTDYIYPASLDERLLPLLRASVNNGPAKSAMLALRQYQSVFLRHQEKVILNSAIQFLDAVDGYKCTLPTMWTDANDYYPIQRARHLHGKYADSVVLPLLESLAWTSGTQYIEPTDAKTPHEGWDVGEQDTRRALPDW